MPRRRSARPRFESLAFQVAAARRSGARRTARAALRRAFPHRTWTLVPLAPARGEFEAVPARRTRIAPGPAWDLAYRLRAQPRVLYAEPLFEVDNRQQYSRPAARGSGGDNDPGTATAFEWSLESLRVKPAWALFSDGRPGSRAVVAHPDTGFTRHPELEDARLLVADGYDFEDDDPDPTDPLTGGTLRNPGHGTGTASVIVSAAGPPAGSPAGSFVSGVAPFASLIPIRTTKSVVLWSMRRLTRAIRYAIEQKAHVISISLGGAFGGTALQNAVRDAEAAGLIVLCAAGNEVGFVVFPAAYDEVIAVAASRIDDTPWPGSSHGEAVDITAPGSSVWCARVEKRGNANEYRVTRSSGTSYAVAQTAGVAALWLSFHGRTRLATYGSRLSHVFRALLQATCRTPRGWDSTEFGPGIARADRLLQAALPPGGGRAARRAYAARAPRHPFEDLVHQLAPAPRDGVTRALARLLNVDEATLPGVLTDLGAELSMHVGIDPALRDRLRRAAIGATGRSRAATTAQVQAARRRLSSPLASTRLRGLLRGGVRR